VGLNDFSWILIGDMWEDHGLMLSIVYVLAQHLLV